MTLPVRIFSETFDGKIWQVLASQDGRYLIAEVRNEARMKAVFCCLDMQRLELWPIEPLPDDWWVAMEGEQTGVIYFKQYRGDDNPEIAHRFAYEIARKHLTNEVATLSNSPDLGRSPQFYPADSTHLSLIKDFVRTVSAHTMSDAGAEYLEFDDHVAVSYYIGDKEMANYLLIADMRRNVVFHELLADKLSGIGQDTFMIVDNKLIFVQQKTELCIYQL